MEGGFLWLMTVGGQAGEEMNEDVERAAMAAVLDLADVLELVVNALDERPFAQQQLVGVGQQPFAHVAAHFGNQAQAVTHPQLLSQRLRDVATVTEELAKQAARELALLEVVANSPWADERPQLDRMATLPLGPLAVPPAL